MPGQHRDRPTIVDVQLLSAAEWTAWLRQRGVYDDVRGIDPATLIWELEFTHAALALGCTRETSASCVHDHLYLSLNAMNGQSLGFVSPAGGTPGNFMP